MKVHAAIAIFTISVFMGCKGDDPVLIDPGYAYFNLKSNSYIAYDVDSLVYDIPSGIQDTFQFQIKEVLDTTFFDLEGRPTARIERFYRDEASDPWVLKKIWVANRTTTRAEKVEENVRFVKMVFPVDEFLVWDGNAQNVFEDWDYRYQDIATPKQIGPISFDNTVTVIQRDISNLIEEEFAQEIYAYDVGMVYKQLDTLKYSLSGGIQTLRTGIKFKMTAFEFGVE
ncbi:MAG: hypothetical protein O2867_01170 [Bacteroidetes bacterium]|jgi:hypothetical protein|nr:hypothetical protein [Bacteroidota bacterium]MDA0972320.1 hypothetical protein [Bacteroidota bacterium]